MWGTVCWSPVARWVSLLQRDWLLDLTPIFDWCPEVDVLCNTAGVLMTTNYFLSSARDSGFWDQLCDSGKELTRYYLTQMLEKRRGSSSICAPLFLAWWGGGHAYIHALAGLPNSWPWIMQKRSGFRFLVSQQVLSKRLWPPVIGQVGSSRSVASLYRPLY